MAIQQGLTNSFKQEMLQAGQNLATDTLKMALYTAFSDIGPETTVYTATNEITGTGYTAGGVVMTGVTIVLRPQALMRGRCMWTLLTCRGPVPTSQPVVR